MDRKKVREMIRELVDDVHAGDVFSDDYEERIDEIMEEIES